MLLNICSAAQFKALENLPDKQPVRPPRKKARPQAVNTDDPEVDEEGEKEDVGNASTDILLSVVDSLDIRVARGQGDSASDGERKSSAEFRERFRPHLVKDAARQKAKVRKAEAPPVARGTQQSNKGRKPASDSSSESDSSHSSESDNNSESSSSKTSEEEPTAEPAGSDCDSSSFEQGRNDCGKRAKVERPPKQAKKKQIQQESAFDAAIGRGKKQEASRVAPVQSALVDARLTKRAKFAEEQSVKGKDGKAGKKRPAMKRSRIKLEAPRRLAG
jgi:hypothetical protein